MFTREDDSLLSNSLGDRASIPTLGLPHIRHSGKQQHVAQRLSGGEHTDSVIYLQEGSSGHISSDKLSIAVNNQESNIKPIQTWKASDQQ